MVDQRCAHSFHGVHASDEPESVQSDARLIGQPTPNPTGKRGLQPINISSFDASALLQSLVSNIKS